MKRIFRKDERGITLQTLIVTAVLVLMAGAAGVVIVSITNSQADNLEGQNAGIEARCEPWEIFDPTLEASGRGGGQGGLGSSAIGCKRVCYIYNKTANDAFAANDVIGSSAATGLELRMSRADIATSATAAANVNMAFVVTGSNSLSAKNNDKDAAEAIKLSALEVKPQGTGTTAIDYDPANMTIEVANNGRYCQVWNEVSDEMILRSS